MPTKKTSKNTKKQKGNRRKVVVILVIVFVLLVAGLTYKIHSNRVAEQKELDTAKTQLDKADQQMSIVYDRIVAEVGKPQYENHQKSCSYPSLKFEKGKPSCGPSYFIAYGIDNNEKFDSIIEKVKSAINTSNITQTESANTYDSRTYGSNSAHITIQLQSINKIDCSLDTKLDNSDYFSFNSEKKYIADKLATTLLFECSKILDKPVYSVSK